MWLVASMSEGLNLENVWQLLRPYWSRYLPQIHIFLTLFHQLNNCKLYCNNLVLYSSIPIHAQVAVKCFLTRKISHIKTFLTFMPVYLQSKMDHAKGDIMNTEDSFSV